MGITANHAGITAATSNISTLITLTHYRYMIASIQELLQKEAQAVLNIQ